MCLLRSCSDTDLTHQEHTEYRGLQDLADRISERKREDGEAGCEVRGDAHGKERGTDDEDCGSDGIFVRVKTAQ